MVDVCPIQRAGLPMSFRATKWAWKLRGISAPQKLVLLRLADHADDVTLECWPSQSYVSEFTGLGERTVRASLKVLETKGLIKRKKRGNRAYRTSDRTTLLLSAALEPSKSSVVINRKPGGEPSDEPEGDAGINRQATPVATGSTCRLISQDEAPKLNLTSSIPKMLLPLMPEYGRPDIDRHNRAVDFIDAMRTDLNGHIDWSAPGIEDPTRIERWLELHDEVALSAKIVATVKRRGNRPNSIIRSWKYFEKEIEPEG